MTEVSNAICILKSGKSDANGKGMSDYFINASHKFSVLLSSLLSSFLHYLYAKRYTVPRVQTKGGILL